MFGFRVVGGAAVVLVCVAAVGCMGASSVDTQGGALTTDITRDGSKQFVYRVPPLRHHGDAARSLEEQQARNSHANDGGFNGRAMSPEESGVGRRKEDVELALEAQVKRKLIATGYCHSEKFITIERNTDPLDTYLRGECLDSATDADRKQFPAAKPR